MVKCATDTETRDISVEVVLEAIRSGGKKLRGQIEQIRNRFESELAIKGGDLKAAKLAVEQLEESPAEVMWCGLFPIVKPVADKLQSFRPSHRRLDDLGDKLPEVRKKLEASPAVFALFPPSGKGLKVFRVPLTVNTQERSAETA
jgi:hypothetical protein